MFKAFFAGKFKLVNGFVSPFTGMSSAGSLSIGNYIINYPQYVQMKEEGYKQKFIAQTENAIKHSKAIAENQRDYISSTWTFLKDESQNTSSIERTFEFKEEYLALEFISLVKEKCDALDHHPFWTFSADHQNKKYSLKINLTSHFAQNNVTENDYDVASYLTYEYERLTQIYRGRCFRGMLSLSLTTILSLIIIKTIVNKYKNWYEIQNEAYKLGVNLSES